MQVEKTAEQKRKSAEAQARYRAKRKALGIKRVTTESEREWQRNYIAQRREEARQRGVVLSSDSWWKDNPEKHRGRTQRWRDENRDRSAELSRRAQAIRRSTPWGVITNRLWPCLHYGVRVNSTRSGLYANALGYRWSELRSHLEQQFMDGMTWDNWGDVWELDHIAPLSSFRYESIDDPLFKEAWKLSNLRPLYRAENLAKGSKVT
jgi:hypothetical protein